MSTSPTVEQAQACAAWRLPMALLGARIVREQWERVLAHEPGARTGQDPEDVHKMRVATRRLRAALRPFGRYLDRTLNDDTYSRCVSADLGTLARALGLVRDLDVQIAELEQDAGDAPMADLDALNRLVEARRVERTTARTALSRSLDGDLMPRLRAAVQRATLVEWPLGRSVHDAGRGPRVRRYGPRLLTKDLRRLRKATDRLVAPSNDELHRVRIRAKHLRYDAEFLAPAYGGTLDELIEVAKSIQDALGVVHDADVAEARLLDDIQRAAQDGERAADAGPLARLVARYQHAREEARDRFRETWAALPSPAALRAKLRRHEAQRGQLQQTGAQGDEVDHVEAA